MREAKTVGLRRKSEQGAVGIEPVAAPAGHHLEADFVAPVDQPFADPAVGAEDHVDRIDTETSDRYDLGNPRRVQASDPRARSNVVKFEHADEGTRQARRQQSIGLPTSLLATPRLRWRRLNRAVDAPALRYLRRREPVTAGSSGMDALLTSSVGRRHSGTMAKVANPCWFATLASPLTVA